MSSKRVAIARRVVVATVTVAIVIAAVVGAIIYWDLSTPCVYMAQPGSLFLRVVSDSNQTLITGAHVSATNTPLLCNGFPVAAKTTTTFVTNSTEWRYVGGGVSAAAFSFDVKYAAHSYSFSAGVTVEGVTCVTLFIPSGNTNVTWGTFQFTCPPRESNASSSSTNSSTISTPLQLHISLNATKIYSGQAISAEVTITNPLNQNFSIVPDYQTDGSILQWNSYDFQCGGLAASNPTWSLAGYALFQGHYTASNLSSAGTPLYLIPPIDLSCPAMPNPISIIFYPNGSSTATYFGSGQVVRGQATVNATTVTYVNESGSYGYGPEGLFGYWVGPPNSGWGQNGTVNSPYFHYFSPGEYTLAVEDMWGGSSFSYFQVASAPP